MPAGPDPWVRTTQPEGECRARIIAADGSTRHRPSSPRPPTPWPPTPPPCSCGSCKPSSRSPRTQQDRDRTRAGGIAAVLRVGRPHHQPGAAPGPPGRTRLPLIGRDARPAEPPSAHCVPYIGQARDHPRVGEGCSAVCAHTGVRAERVPVKARAKLLGRTATEVPVPNAGQIHGRKKWRHLQLEHPRRG